MIGKYIFSKLSAITAITDLIESGGTVRLYPVVAPLETTTPYVIYRVTGIIPRDDWKGGPAEKDNYNVSFSIVERGDGSTEAGENLETLFEAIRSGLEYVADTAGGVTVEQCIYLPSGADDIDPNTGLIFKTLDMQFSVVR